MIAVDFKEIFIVSLIAAAVLFAIGIIYALKTKKRE